MTQADLLALVDRLTEPHPGMATLAEIDEWERRTYCRPSDVVSLCAAVRELVAENAALRAEVERLTKDNKAWAYRSRLMQEESK